jgi:hypothetical protein
VALASEETLSVPGKDWAKVELVINLKIAKTISLPLLGRADEVIE